MSGIEIFIIVIMALIGASGIIGLLLFMLIFPLINALFGTKLPTYNYKDSTLNDPDFDIDNLEIKLPFATLFNKMVKRVTGFSTKEKDIKSKNGSDKKQKNAKNKEELLSASSANDDSSKNKDFADIKKSKPPKSLKDIKNIEKTEVVVTETVKQKNKSPQKPKIVDLHKDVPTVRIPALLPRKTKEPVLTIAKIDAAVRAEKKRLAAINLENVQVLDNERAVNTNTILFEYDSSKYVNTIVLADSRILPARDVKKPVNLQTIKTQAKPRAKENLNSCKTLKNNTDKNLNAKSGTGSIVRSRPAVKHKNKTIIADVAEPLETGEKKTP